MIKICYVCKQAKEVEHFGLANNSKGDDGRAAYCIDCSATLTEREKAAIVTKLWRIRNKVKHDKQHKNYSLQKTYGISIDQYNEMLHEQNSVCAVCFEPSTVMRKDGRIHSLCVDHDHRTGEVRSLLCHTCNTLLGHIEIDPARVQRLLSYLKLHKENQKG